MIRKSLYKTIYGVCFMCVLAICTPAHAGWTEDMRITDRGYEIYPQIIARNDTLHVAWWQISGDHLVSYMHSLDGGQTWGELVDLSEQEHRSYWIDLSLSSDKIIAGWGDNIPLETVHIAYSTSLGGDYWPLPSYLIPDDYRAGPMAFCSSGDSLYFAYLAYDADSTGHNPIRFFYSSNNGNTWGNEQTVEHSPEDINGMLLAKCGGSLYIVWTGVPYPELIGYEAMAVVSHDGGESWSDRIMLSVYGLPYAQLPCLACNDSTDELAVGWMDNNYPGDLFLRITADGGDTWEPEIHVTDHNAISRPNIEFVGDTLWAVWEDLSFAEQRELGFSKSVNRGQSWSAIERLTYAEGQSHRPWLSYDNGKLHLVWDDDRPSMEVYYKRWEPETAVDDITNPVSIACLESYPNPFNSSTVISYSNIKGGDIEIYDITGRLVKTLTCGGGKEGKIIWDATDESGNKVSSGIYFVRVSAPKHTKTIKLVYLK